MNGLPYYLVLLCIVMLLGVWAGLMFDWLYFRDWMHDITHFMEHGIKGASGE